jgi:hypothetical protein
VNSCARIRGRLALTAVLLLIGSAAHAQRWMTGVATGVGQGGFTGSEEFNWNRAMPTVSFFGAYAIDARWSVRPELAYVRKVGESQIAASTLTMTADYLQLPVQMRYTIPSAAGIRPFVGAGPTLGFKVRCTLAFRGGGVRSSDDCDDERGVQSNRLDFGVLGSLGADGMIGRTLVGVEARYGVGLRSFVVPLDRRNSRSYGWSILVSGSWPVQLRRPAPVPATLPLPPMRLEPSVTAPQRLPEQPAESSTIVTRTRGGRLITVNAVDVDARTLLLAVAREAQLNVVVASDVRARVSVALNDVSALDAIKAIIDVAGLAVIVPQQPAEPVVFLRPAVNVNRASPEVISSRFGVSSELAKWVAAHQTPGSRTP